MKKTIIAIILPLIIIAGVFVWRLLDLKSRVTLPAVCTQEAKLCSDGFYVGRTGPNCEFAACPVVAQPQIPADWKTFIDMVQGISFKYPETLGTKYITTQEWPPKITITNETMMPCLKPTKIINNDNYCYDSTSEGAAGTIYTIYNYLTPINSKIISFHFILRYPQCGNYPDPQMTECNTERSTFSLDSLIDQIARSVKMN